MRLKNFGYTVTDLNDSSSDKITNDALNGENYRVDEALLNREQTLIVRTNSIEIPESNLGKVDDGMIVAFLEELRHLGYWINEDSLKTLKTTDPTTLLTIIEAAKKTKGADVEYKPMYPNFPKQVADASDLELWTNAIVHYIGRIVGVHVMPKYDIEKRAPLQETTTLTVLGLSTPESVTEYVNSIVNQSQPYSENDKKSIEIFRDSIDFNAISTNVKENLVWLAKTFMDEGFLENGGGNGFKTTTDVLRYATALSNGDITLATNTRFRLTRSQRRQVLGLLEFVIGKYKSVDTLYADMASSQERWKRLAKTLHYHEWKTKGVSTYPKSELVLQHAQENRLRSYDSKVEAAIKNGNVDGLIDVLKQRPGVYARRLIELGRKFPNDKDKIYNEFSKVAGSVSSAVLIQLINLLNGPLHDDLEYRTIILKSATAQKSAIIENKLTSREEDLQKILRDALRDRKIDTFVELGPDADEYVVPLNIRNVSEGVKQIGCGSKFTPKDDKNIIRLFMHWHDLSEAPSAFRRTVDLDLSAVYLNEDFSKVETIAYYNLRDSDSGLFHSGDITSAPNGAAEFIDVDRKLALRRGYRYVAPCVYSYSGQSFNKVPEAYAGVMFRDKSQDGGIFEPSTVDTKYDLNSESVNSIPFIYDLKENKIIWWDMSASGSSLNRLNNVHDNQDRILIALKTLVMSNSMTVSELADLTANVVHKVDVTTDSGETTHVWADSHGDVIENLTDENVKHIEGWESEKILGLLS